jgi:hypothetical protein
VTPQSEIIGFERKIELMRELGDLSVEPVAPFHWLVKHVYVIIDHPDGSSTVPQGQDTNPYGAIENHFAILTQPGVHVMTGKPDRLVEWDRIGWRDII